MITLFGHVNKNKDSKINRNKLNQTLCLETLKPGLEYLKKKKTFMKEEESLKKATDEGSLSLGWAEVQ